ncbi:unnamed protein product [Didymodactylos carnosus]|uniref:Retrotransposon gag domain-containing protein n=1 Tax=Didymodactylos carnosus TaxID=1234261 RepID=A0A8S2FA33_9BILA|nr:unnamed protein product [Didymodactylos carnosus]CAF4205605.1 unnamed protein product [Didymodactylos carnosus]
MAEKLLNSILSKSLEKLPKFSGTITDDVDKWIIDITHELNLVKLDDSHKLAVIQTYLDGDARRWYTNNLQMMHNWATFLRELRATFSSSFSKEAAIKQIGNRQQHINETVFHYYTDMMELANRIDHQMNDELKVAYLTTGLKISLKKEVLRNKPQTPAEFIKYAQDEEKLDSSITTQISNDNRLTIPIDYVASSVRSPLLRASNNLSSFRQQHRQSYYPSPQYYSANLTDNSLV